MPNVSGFDQNFVRIIAETFFVSSLYFLPRGIMRFVLIIRIGFSRALADTFLPSQRVLGKSNNDIFLFIINPGSE